MGYIYFNIMLWSLLQKLMSHKACSEHNVTHFQR